MFRWREYKYTFEETCGNKVWLNQEDIILLSQNFRDDKSDVIVKYTTDEAGSLKGYGELPEDSKINVDNFGDEDWDCTFAFGDDGEVDIDDI